MAGKTENIYAAYKRGVFMARGTYKELSKLTGLKTSTLKVYAIAGSSKTWDIVREDEYVSKNRVKRGELIKIYRKNDYDIDELAEVVGIPFEEMELKVTGRLHFKKSELEELEDLFFLEEGELIK